MDPHFSVQGEVIGILAGFKKYTQTSTNRVQLFRERNLLLQMEHFFHERDLHFAKGTFISQQEH